MKNSLIASLLFGAFFLSISSSHADSVPFVSTPCDTTNVSANGSDATVCKGSFSGTDSVSEITNLFGAELGASETWIEAVKSDDSSGKLVATTATGTWEYTGDTLSSPFVIVLKASTSFSAYLFKDLGNLATDSTGGFFINWLNNGGQTPKLSHMTIYSKTNTSAVPLPAALWLFGPALLGFMGFRRKNQS